MNTKPCDPMITPQPSPETVIAKAKRLLADWDVDAQGVTVQVLAVDLAQEGWTADAVALFSEAPELIRDLLSEIERLQTVHRDEHENSKS